ncbi:hypothetical protein [Sorangium sp. So ce854]|uniref:hypothetical protein n=1 Tax=Sorangium sp. So ce854 TaxID=3133322 RepID=UPI003F62F556
MGVVYGEEHARDGFPRHLVGVHLFPVPALESLGLLAIGVAGLVALRSSAPGGVLVRAEPAAMIQASGRAQERGRATAARARTCRDGDAWQRSFAVLMDVKLPCYCTWTTCVEER